MRFLLQKGLKKFENCLRFDIIPLLSGGRAIAALGFSLSVEESPGSRKQGAPRKRGRVTASQSHRDYVGPDT